MKALSKEYALFISLITLVLFTVYEHTLSQTSMGNIVGFLIKESFVL